MGHACTDAMLLGRYVRNLVHANIDLAPSLERGFLSTRQDAEIDVLLANEEGAPLSAGSKLKTCEGG